ncbi:MAG: FtsW/RodA/SpoVE family cell cycle protein [Bryobacteraceae bacterium]|nr:FtsW/RodA/SpoVE family cell cycle protein [Bryobacteraceae bacterium]
MAVTRSTAADRARRGAPVSLVPPSPRNLELALLAAASVVAVFALVLTYQARVATMPAPERTPLDLGKVDRREQLLPYLDVFAGAQEREYASRRLLALLREEGGLENVGALGRIRVPVKDVMRPRGFDTLRERAAAASKQGAETISLFTPQQIAQVKPSLVVRDESAYRWRLVFAGLLFAAPFYLLHVFWRVRRFRGSEFVLPALHLLSGLGLALMVSLRDPLRDTLSFFPFAQGVALGCVVLGAASAVDYRRVTGRLAYVPLILSFLLSVALIAFGSGPGTSDAKVNLLGFQPAEVIRVLVVFFLAGYFASHWEFLRTLREERPELKKLSRWVEVPRLEYVVPLVLAVGLSLAFFFLQKDLGPALIIACLFLAMYAVARDRYLLASAGLALMLGGFLAGYMLGYPRTVSNRVAMWLNPWDNAIRGGDQVVHSLWAFSTGGIFGTGLGLGDPQYMPTAHTDLILSAASEETGFLGLLGIAALYALLLAFGFRTALRARSDYNFFLALGLTLSVGFQILLIAGGVLGVLPLSGVVAPFLSYGRTALIVNFAILGVLLALSHERGSERESVAKPFWPATRGIAMAVGVAGAVILAKAAWVQVVRADATLGAGVFTVQADGYKRYAYNPRLMAIARSIPRGTIFDRNGVPLASRDWAEIEKNREQYARMGISLPAMAPRDDRFYPLGASTVHLLGDLRTRANWGARNSSLAERDYAVTLQGYDDRALVVELKDPQSGKPVYTVRYDYRELVPLLRHRYEPNHEAVRRVRERDRSLKLSIDARLQKRATDILAAQLQKLKREKGAAVILDAETGDLLASVSYPLPAQMPPVLTANDEDDTLLDRARYGLYPPGSSFKIVTAMAALRRDPKLANVTHQCVRLPDGRIGNYVKGWGRPIRDDVKDTAAHGTVAMAKGITVSCNAYFAQLATYEVGAPALLETAKQLNISVATPETVQQLQRSLPQAGFGQGQVVASPFQMARVAATVAAAGKMPYGRWVVDQNNNRTQEPQVVLEAAQAEALGGFMRSVVTSGTGRAANTPAVAIAGKTGTAEIERGPSHAWFIGFAPVNGPRKLAFAVLVENGQYGGTAAAPAAAEMMRAAAELGLFARQE